MAWKKVITGSTWLSGMGHDQEAVRPADKHGFLIWMEQPYRGYISGKIIRSGNSCSVHGISFIQGFPATCACPVVPLG